MVTGFVIPADSEQPLRQIDVSIPDAVAQAVDGFMEAVDLPAFGATLYVNEEGLLRHLPFNSRATFLWWYHVPPARQHAMLVGDAVIVGLPDLDGADTAVPSEAQSLMLATSPFRVEVRVTDDPKWYTNQAIYPDYWEAIVWAMLLLERWTMAEDVRVVPVEPGAVESSAA
jgi:hypothetical protein